MIEQGSSQRDSELFDIETLNRAFYFRDQEDLIEIQANQEDQFSYLDQLFRVTPHRAVPPAKMLELFTKA